MFDSVQKKEPAGCKENESKQCVRNGIAVKHDSAWMSAGQEFINAREKHVTEINK